MHHSSIGEQRKRGIEYCGENFMPEVLHARSSMKGVGAFNVVQAVSVVLLEFADVDLIGSGLYTTRGGKDIWLAESR